MTNEILPPQAIEAERSILGAAMLSADAIYSIVNLPEQCFYRVDHQKIFREILNLHREEQPVDVVTLSERLERKGELEQVGGLAYLGTLAKDTPRVSNVSAYVKIVKQKAMLRNLIDLANSMSEQAYERDANPDAVIDFAGKHLDDVLNVSVVGEAEHIAKGLEQEIDAIDKRFRAGGQIVGLSTGFEGLDQLLYGLEKGALYILAARPAMGKTALLSNIWQNVGMNQKVGLFLSLEMPATQLSRRLLANIGRIDHGLLRAGSNLKDDDFQRMTVATKRLIESGMYVCDLPSLSVQRVRAIARKLQRKHGLDFIAVDYLQIMGSDEKTENRTQEVTKFSSGLKAIAKEFDVPVVVLSQLNRGIENRANKRPMMSDLRESGAIEQDADAVCFLYRDDYYNKDENSPLKGFAELIIGKNRNGDTGTVPLKWEGQYQAFSNLSPTEKAKFEHFSKQESGSKMKSIKGGLS